MSYHFLLQGIFLTQRSSLCFLPWQVDSLPLSLWGNKYCCFTLVRQIPWSRKWQPTLVFLPGKFRGHRNLVGCNPWGCKESDTAEHAHMCVACVGWESGCGLAMCFWLRVPPRPAVSWSWSHLKAQLGKSKVHPHSCAAGKTQVLVALG